MGLVALLSALIIGLSSAMFGSLRFVGTPSGSDRYSWKPPCGSGEWKKAPPMPALDFETTSAFGGAFEPTSFSVAATYEFPCESQATVGSTQPSAVLPSISVNCQYGGVWSPHVRPPSELQATPQWLNPLRESFCATSTRLGSSGSTATAVPGCWRSEQSWLTRTLTWPLPWKTVSQPLERGSSIRGGL